MKCLEKKQTKDKALEQIHMNQPKGSILARMWAFLIIASISALAAADPTPYTMQDAEFYHAVERSFAELGAAGAKSGMVKSSLPELNSAINTAIMAGDHGSAILQLSMNLQLLETALDSSLVMHLFTYLLDQEAVPVANKLIQSAKASGDSYVLSRMYYLMGKHFYQLGQWDVAQQYLSNIEIRAALTKEQSDYATIIFGITLQYQKKHRAALKYYETIEPESVYFQFAQLNKAVVYIRQGWWTDAKMAIEKALQHKSIHNAEEFANRLQLVLGYNQLQHEFYRNARESFRKITLHSRYADRALLGIGLCALNQGDYVGAINAFGILKGKKDINISIAESFLLYAFTHEQMSQAQIASAMYEEAIAFYDRKLRETDATLAILNKGSSVPSNIKTVFGAEESPVPAYISARENTLRFLAEHVRQKRNKKLVLEVQQKLQAQKRDALIRAIEAEKKVLVSYLSQAQFGQAKLFDNIQ